MKLDDACGVLGVSPEDEWPAVRQAYRTLIREIHPDRTVDPTADASTVTAAFAIVSDAHDQGELPRPVQSIDVSAPAPLAPRDDVALLRIPSPDPFLHLLDVAHRLGDVTYQDASTGLFMVLVHDPGSALCQLTGEMTMTGDEVQVQFSLEPLGVGSAPPIAEVVARFGALSRTG